MVAIGDGMTPRDVAVIRQCRGCRSLRRTVWRTGNDDHRRARGNFAPNRRTHHRKCRSPAKTARSRSANYLRTACESAQKLFPTANCRGTTPGAARLPRISGGAPAQPESLAMRATGTDRTPTLWTPPPWPLPRAKADGMPPAPKKPSMIIAGSQKIHLLMARSLAGPAREELRRRQCHPSRGRRCRRCQSPDHRSFAGITCMCARDSREGLARRRW